MTTARQGCRYVGASNMFGVHSLPQKPCFFPFESAFYGAGVGGDGRGEQGNRDQTTNRRLLGKRKHVSEGSRHCARLVEFSLLQRASIPRIPVVETPSREGCESIYLERKIGTS